MGGDDRAFKGVWICAAVWTNPDLSWIEKALIAEIDSLVRDEAPCYASNDHLAKRIGVSVSRTNDMLARLQKAGFLIRVQYDGRTTHRVVNSEYSSNPETAKRWISQRHIGTPARKVSHKRERRASENRKSGFLFSGNLTCEDQETRVPNNKSVYIKRIPEETPTLETTTTTQLKSDNENAAANEATEESSSRRFFEGEGSSGALHDRNGGRGAEDESALVESLVREFGLSNKQRQAVSEYCNSRGKEYVRSKVDIVRSRPRRNCAGALLTALRDDWRRAVAIGARINEPHKNLLDQETETSATPMNTVISANTRAGIEFDLGFETFGEKKLCEMLAASQDSVRNAIDRFCRKLVKRVSTLFNTFQRVSTGLNKTDVESC